MPEVSYLRPIVRIILLDKGEYNMTETSTPQTVKTYWEVWHYDVWGNAEDGYEVNDRSCSDRCLELVCEVLTANTGTPNEFQYAEVSDAQVKAALGLEGKRIETDGDDATIIANGANTGKPYGELVCISHASLSPVRPVSDMAEVIAEAQAIRY